MEVKSERARAILMMVAVAVLWSTGGLMIKLVSWNPIAIAGTRSAISALVLLAAVRRPRWTWSFAQIGGAVAYTLTVICFVAANKLTTAANTILLQYTAPIYVALFGAWFLGERTNWLDWATITVVILGMVLFFLDNLTLDGLWGNVIALISAVTFASFTIYIRRQKDGSPIETVLLGNVLTAVVALPFIFKSSPGTTGWMSLVFLGVLQLGLPYILYAKAIKHVTALEAVLIPVLEPILNPILVLLALGETPGRWALAGGIIVLGSVTVRCLIGLQAPWDPANKKTRPKAGEEKGRATGSDQSLPGVS